MKFRQIFIKLVLLTIVASVLSGCASKIMQAAPPIDSVNKDMALVTFLLPSSLTDLGHSGRSITPVEFDLWDGRKFIGAISKKTYVQYPTEPGSHVFMASGGNWSCIKADLEAGKNYYIIVNLYPGMSKENVDLKPIKNGSEEMEVSLPKWLGKLTAIAPIPEKYKNYSEKRKRNIERAMKNYESGRVKYALLEPQDGI